MTRSIKTALFAICLGWLFVALRGANFFVPVDSWTNHSEQIADSAWHTLIDYRSNAFLSWRADPWGETLGRWLAPQGSSISYQFGLLMIFWVGTAIFLRAATTRKAAACAAGATVTTLWIALSVGASTIVWGSLAWTPWLALGMVLTRRSAEPFAGVFVLFFALRAASAAAQLTGLALLFALCISHIPLSSASNSLRRHALAWWTGLALLASYLIFLTQVQQAPFPDYPPDGRVIHQLWWSGFIRPLLGFDYLIPALNHPVLQAELVWSYLGLLVLSAAAYYVGRQSSVSRRGAILAASLATIGLWDCIPLQGVWQVGPLAAVSRLLPGLFLGPCSAVLFTAATLPLILALTERFAERLVSTTILITLALAAILTISRDASLSMPQSPVATHRVANTIEDFIAPPWTQRSSLTTPAQEAGDWHAAIFSPSRYVARFFGRSTLALEYAFSKATPEPIAPALQKSWASVAPEEMKFLSDGDSTTRYSTSRAFQDGTETLIFWFKSPQTLLGIQLDPGSFFTDFPRGVEIRGDTICADSPDAAQNSTVLAHFSDWQGPPRRTPQGLPYFGARDDVRIPFSHPATVNCLRIRQTGEDGGFDLSIAEARLIPAPVPH